MIAVGIPLGPGITDCICFIGIINNINSFIDEVRQNVAQPSPAAGRQFNIMHHRSVSRINLIIVIGSGSPLLNKRNSQICRFAQSRCIQPFIINKTVGFDIPLMFRQISGRRTGVCCQLHNSLADINRPFICFCISLQCCRRINR